MSRFYSAIALGIITGGTGLIIILLPFGFKLEENLGLSLLFKLRGAREAPPEIMIVSIDKLSADKLNLPDDPKKWPRSLHARLTDNLTERGASVVVFDLFFNESRSAEDDNLFAESISAAGNVVLSEYLRLDSLTNISGHVIGNELIEKRVLPIPLLSQAAVSVACFPLPKVPGKLSQYWTFKTSAGNIPTIPVIVFKLLTLDVYDEFIQLVNKHGQYPVDELPLNKKSVIESKNVNNVVRLIRDVFERDPIIAKKILKELRSQKTRPLDSEKARFLNSLISTYQGPNTRYLNFYGPPRTITTVPYYEVLHPEDESSLGSRQFDFSNKAVFVGRSENMPSEKDIDTFHTVFSLPSGVDISGVEIAATALANLLEDKPVRPLNYLSYAGILLLWGLAASIIFRLLPTIVSLICAVAVGILYLIFTLYQFKTDGTWYPLVIPLFIQVPIAFLGAIMWNRIVSNKLIKHFLPSEIVQKIIGGERLEEVKSIGQTVYGTCLVTDVEGFTTVCETMDSEEINNFKKKYFGMVFEPLKQHDLLIKKTTGDGIVVAWKEEPEIASEKHPCTAAINIRNAVRLFNQSSDIKFPTRIGLHCGNMSFGIVDAAGKYEYDISGATINSTQRIEALNKELGTQILLSEEVLTNLNGFLTREVGKFLLAGKTNPLVVYELICMEGESTEQQRNICSLFSQALKAFRGQAWEEASIKFNELINIFGQDGPSDYYLGLCEQFRQTPPGKSWEGEIKLNKK